ncbi:hypothetical protein O6H91_22G024500 [Diphasiastrum complanatum]|uniref:Uncharacterized protein n=2 Tax=Diphasiastrum complanatum TaxID=34168 RepID=A0ACC2ADY6_DIPCM|nr:hypothetical protein O6H91_22G024500 [Diphasiastrum complanatum]KAJ7515711.1 hypothetical protein O6H91_22G024500 [Diphasiastrum complanatum]
MDLKVLQKKLGMSEESPALIRKAQELQRLSNVSFDSASFGVGDVCKSILCFELACTALDITFDRYKGIRLSGLSEKAYLKSFNALQNALGLRKEVDVRQLAVQFGCVRLIETVRKALTMYKQRFIMALPEARRSSADFGRPVFVAVAFYLCAKKHQLKVDKARLMEICGVSESEFTQVSTSMMDLCFDILGVQKEKKDPTLIKFNRELLDSLPGKRRIEEADESASDCESIDEDDHVEVPGFKRSKRSEAKAEYKEWKSKVVATRTNNSMLLSAKGYSLWK